MCLTPEWKRRAPRVEKEGSATVKEIQILGDIFAKDNKWLPNFKASSEWARGMKKKFEGDSYKKSGGNQYSEVFDEMLTWTKGELDTRGKAYADDYKTRYTQLNGAPAKRWSNVYSRVRDRLDLNHKFTTENYVGKSGRTCKRQKWFWVRK